MGGAQRWRCTDLFTVETQKYVLELNKINKYKNKIKYLPNGFFDDLEHSDIARRLNNIKGRNHIILTVGRLGSYQKNSEMLVKAFSALRINNKLEGWKLYLVGDATKEFIDYLSDLFSQNEHLREEIILTGFIGDKAKLAEYYCEASVFVLSSRFESWGLVVPEAMHFNNYVILTKSCDAFYEMSNDGEYCRFINSEDELALQEALLSVANNYSKYMSVAQLGAKYVDSHYNWKAISAKLEQYFFEVMSK